MKATKYRVVTNYTSLVGKSCTYFTFNELQTARDKKHEHMNNPKVRNTYIEYWDGKKWCSDLA